jgi:hypothetical protein
MGAVEHLKTLCCLGLKPESAMIAVVPLLHEIIPHGWSRLGLIAPDATMTASRPKTPRPERYSGSICGGSWMIHRPWLLYGTLCSAPWASVGRCTGRAATISKAGER